MRTFTDLAPRPYGMQLLGYNVLSAQADHIMCAWPMSDGAGRVLQEVVSGRHGRMKEPNTGEYTWTADPRFGPCLRFNAVNANNVILVEEDRATGGPYSRGLAWWKRLTVDGSATITYWVRCPTLPVFGTVFTVFSFSGSVGLETAAENQALVLEIVNIASVVTHRIRWESGAGVDTSLLSVATVPANTWIHVAAVRDNDAKTLTFYLNGVPETPQAYVNNPDGADDGMVVIGRDAQSASDAMKGNIRDLRLYRGTKTPGEIREIVQNGGELYTVPQLRPTFGPLAVAVSRSMLTHYEARGLVTQSRSSQYEALAGGIESSHTVPYEARGHLAALRQTPWEAQEYVPPLLLDLTIAVTAAHVWVGGAQRTETWVGGAPHARSWSGGAQAVEGPA